MFRFTRPKGPASTFLLATILVSLAMTGCATTYQQLGNRPGNLEYLAVEKDLLGKLVTITQGDGQVSVGRNVRINADQTTWRHGETGALVSVPTSSVWQLQYSRAGSPAAKGLGVGFLIGGGFGVLAGAADENPSLAIPVGAVVFGSLGGLMGLLGGALSSETVTWEINPVPAPSTGQ